MSLEHARVGEERLVGRDQRQAVAISELEERALDLVLDGQAMALQLDIEPPGEDAGELEQEGLCRRQLPLGEEPADRPLDPAGEGEKASVGPGKVGEGHLGHLPARRS